MSIIRRCKSGCDPCGADWRAQIRELWEKYQTTVRYLVVNGREYRPDGDGRVTMNIEGGGGGGGGAVDDVQTVSFVTRFDPDIGEDITVEEWTSCVDADGVAAIPVAAADSSGKHAGTIIPDDGATYGVDSSNGSLAIVQATQSQIIAKTDRHHPITPANLDIAVIQGLTNNSGTLSTTQKAAARAWIGAGTGDGEGDGTVDSILVYRGRNAPTESGYVEAVDEPTAVIHGANNSLCGTVRPMSGGGLYITEYSEMHTDKASDIEIAAKTNVYKPIVPANLDTAVIAGITANATALTASQQEAAKAWLGIQPHTYSTTGELAQALISHPDALLVYKGSGTGASNARGLWTYAQISDNQVTMYPPMVGGGSTTTAARVISLTSTNNIGITTSDTNTNIAAHYERKTIPSSGSTISHERGEYTIVLSGLLLYY